MYISKLSDDEMPILLRFLTVGASTTKECKIQFEGWGDKSGKKKQNSKNEH